MIQLAKPTLLTRMTVTQTWRAILPPEDLSIIRRVQILVPTQPAVYGALTPDLRYVDRDTGKPLTNIALAYGHDRSYKGTLLPPGAQIVLHLLPEQSFWASCEIEYAELGVLCEYMAVDSGATSPRTVIPVPGGQGSPSIPGGR